MPFALILESIKFSFSNLKSNLLRTVLSLLGITIGVFCIVSILTLVDSLEASIKDSTKELSDQSVFVEKWPWTFGADYPWWKYVNRDEVRPEESDQLKQLLPEDYLVSYNMASTNEMMKAADNTASGITINGIGYDFLSIMPMDFSAGRYFSEEETRAGAESMILGYNLSHRLFLNPRDAIGKYVLFKGRKLLVTGVLAKVGNSTGMKGGMDDRALIPMNFLRRLGYNSQQSNHAVILVKGGKGIDMDALTYEVEGAMRQVRRLPPEDESDFAVNKMTMFYDILKKLFGQISKYGWIIAAFSIIVGGFGIANIMFVSVKERTNIIGIQKALGAKKGFILMQFLVESVMLCILGGIVGLLLIWLLGLALTALVGFPFALNSANVLIGLSLSAAIGILSGLIPSVQAAGLDPIEAIRSNG